MASKNPHILHAASEDGFRRAAGTGRNIDVGRTRGEKEACMGWKHTRSWLVEHSPPPIPHRPASTRAYAVLRELDA